MCIQDVTKDLIVRPVCVCVQGGGVWRYMTGRTEKASKL